ncbi:LysR substrate-binding domain-containing protein [Ramlibacter tataouinensis]|uniref:LysR substrate-binding domain-containing protein n=1 Tax=Ramlibacter tataouinensis TaxID=94132 RepID=UPI0022F3A144|nr:LysR substrate-binding domain-containing protein [Ramlibacter tataouinensis]WBY03850.1 LysR substrate-binding domain-containing protein [Ramlibacter tataouinensis]
MTRPLQFRQIEAFRAVMQTGTTTAAATVLHTTQPSVSRLLGQMAAATGLKLFEAERGRLRPTREARDLFEVIERNFLGLARIEQRVAVLRHAGAGTLRIGSTPALGLSVLPRTVAALRRQHPEVHVSLHTRGGLQLWEGLHGGAFDLVLSTMPSSMAPASATVLHRAAVVCVMHPDHPLAGRQRLHVRDLRQQTLLTLPADDDLQLQLQRLLHEYGVQPVGGIETSYSFTICRLAAEGAGVGVVNPYVASVFARDLRIVPLLPRRDVQVVLGHAPHLAPSRMADAFVALVAAELKRI